MVLGVLKNKWFLTMWLGLSAIGGIIGFVLSSERDKRLSGAQTAICQEFRNLKYPSIIAIDDPDNKDKYLGVLMDTSIKYTNFRFIGIDNEQEVKILDYSKDSLIVQIAIIRDKSTIGKPRYQELWIWRKFLKTETKK